MEVLALEGVTKSFRIPSVRRDTVRQHVLGLFRHPPEEELRVLDGISFSVRRGETLGIMGRNGCGKSTLLKILCGIYRPDAGRVAVGAPLTPILELGLGWNPDLDAVDNVELLGTVMGMPLGALRAATPSILEFAELERFARLELRHYSSGMALRLAFAVAIHAVRDVLVLDEVFAVGDAGFRHRCEERLQRLRAAGHTVILVSHEAGPVLRFCDRVLLLEQGRVLRQGSAEEIVAEYLRITAEG